MPPTGFQLQNEAQSVSERRSTAAALSKGFFSQRLVMA
jgi:hypothetical protein